MVVSNKDDFKARDDRGAGIVFAGGIVVFFIVYWYFEVQSVRELLEMAYG
tara:strand:+ start:3984 stop:4133 length:150 start_codon:yes stop_codon:yes gene_type:complete